MLEIYSYYFLGAGALSILWFLVHIFVGGKDVISPLKNAVIDSAVRDTLYICWHFSSFTILMIGCLFLIPSFYNGLEIMAMIATILAIGFSAIGIIMTFLLKQNHLKVPQGWLFIPIAILGLFGLNLF